GAEYLLPVKVRTAAFVGQEGYYTETHAMGVVRAGEVILTPRTTPSRFEVGAGWRFGTAAGEIAYAITARTPQGELTIAAQDGSGETLTAFGVGDRLDLTRVRVAGDRPDTGGLTLAFDASGGFSLSMDGAPDLVTGRTAVAGSGKAVMLSLIPTEPAWAAARRVDVRCEAQGRELRLITTIGALAPANVAPGAPRR
ncbi:hypothetical protein, partial [Phenylobacterium sp.]|uniref:hypothetical protein n=1 Tax=Phenylobacterium sp. TaxID=1871053 RepID=UPI002DEF18BE|nr:hypothetical protein [Phenylobacterium sp.]